MKPYKVIGHYEPTVWSPRKVAEDIMKITRRAGLRPLPLGKHRLHKGKYVSKNNHADVMRRTPKHDTADLQWHHDGDISGADMDCGIVVWASNTPTEISYNGHDYTPKKRDVIYFNNLDCLHRRPENAPKMRWLFRQRVKKL